MAQLLSGMGAGLALMDERRTLDWAALNERVNRWVHALRELGLCTGDVVAIVAGNRVETFEALLACLHTGLTVVPVNWHLTASEIAYLASDSDARAVLVDEARAPVVAGLDCPVKLVLGSGVESLLAQASPREPASQCCGSVMLYTSGTTGTPKGVVNRVFTSGAPMRQVSRLLAYAGLVLGVPAGKRALLIGPWYHSAQLYFALLPLLRGCALVIRECFDPVSTLEDIDLQEIAVCHLVPTQFVRLLRLPEQVRQRFRGDSLARVWHGGGPCAPEVKRQMIDWWGPVIVEYYAATEGGVVTVIGTAEWLSKPGSVGRAIAPTKILIVGPDGSPLPVGIAGRVFLCRGEAQDFHYHGAPDKTISAHLAPGVYTYGELGYLDEDGYLFLAGRAQDVIISGGVNIYPAEIEAVLLVHEAVRDAVVIGSPDEEYGERVLAVVELGDLSAEDAPAILERHCRTRLAGFKVPRVWRFVALMPRDETGKLRQNALWSEVPIALNQKGSALRE